VKKLICLALALWLALGAAGAWAEETDARLIEKAAEMARALAECGASDAYLTLFSLSREVREQAAAFAAGLSGTPQRALGLRVDPEALLAAMGGELDGIPALARKNMMQRMPAAMLQQFVARKGVNAVAATAVMQLSDSLLLEEPLPGVTILLLDFGGETALACVFIPSEYGGGAVGCTAMPLPWDEDVQGSLRMLASQGAFALEEIQQ